MSRTYLDEEVITRQDLEALPEYSCTNPTGVTIGKRWRCGRRWRRPDPENQEWLIKTYVRDPHNDNMALISVVWAVDADHEPWRGDLRGS